MSTKYYVLVQLIDMNDDKVLASGTCQTDAETVTDVKLAAGIAASEVTAKLEWAQENNR